VNAAPPFIDVSKAPAPLYDDPITHGATDPFVLWIPARGEYFMYYTQRRANLANGRGVEWVHGSKIGIAHSKDGVNWEYLGTCEGDHNLSDPLNVKDTPAPTGGGITWWAPCFLYDDAAKKFHMFVTRVDGIYDRWVGNRDIVHFVSDDAIHWTYKSTATLSSRRTIDATVYKVNPADDTWYMVYKDEAAGSHTFRAQSKDLDTWTNPTEVTRDVGQEAPYVFHWKDAWWLIVDAHAKGLRVYKSANGIDNWEYNNTVLAGTDGTRPRDNSVGLHPGIVLQQTPAGDTQCLVYYFTQQGRPTVMQLAELELGPDGKMVCNRNKFAPATRPAAR
jgi:hypothetical protein